ncbi:DNA polymerase subunit beta [Lederbergia ruris]|uniref:DNA polymerase subunit beta n=1 Tax=Lederbergia ruris TaxID=217495 RepID=A0ABQ4KJZ5_9BACI|nr:nucleotidyltransferase domain-containing protein [Lederbergia ruris]GIN58281.1 DNA polymerase subunit beta [Lederbergia ruris]
MIDLSFINSPVHQNLINKIYDEMIKDDEVIGILIQGSVARGENYQSSDLDIFVLLKDDLKRTFSSEYRRGILVEYKYSNFESALKKCETQPSALYNFLDAIILFDKKGTLKYLELLVITLFKQYKTPKSEMQSIAYWLESSHIKIIAAEEAKDMVKACFVLSTTSWKILEGIWAVNNRPMPPNGSVLYYLRFLDKIPDKEITSMFIGNEKDRIESAKIIIGWTIDCLKKQSSS